MKIDLGGKVAKMLIVGSIVVAAGTIIYFENKKDFVIQEALTKYNQLMERVEESIFPFERYINNRRTTKGYNI